MTKKSKKAPTLQYGIEITKPFSKTMYAHNDEVAKQMKFNIRSAWADELIKFNGSDDWPTGTSDTIVLLQSYVCAVGYGEGFTIDQVNKDFLKELDTIANWQLHEQYSYLSFKQMVPRTRFMMVGFEWQKHDYSYCQEQDLSPVSPEADSNAEVEIPCSLELDMQMANESENIQ